MLRKATLLAAILIAGPVRADAEYFTLLAPEMRQLGAPAWVRPGYRLTYKMSHHSGPGKAGTGYLQCTVVAAAGPAVALEHRSFGELNPGQLTLDKGFGEVGHPWAVGMIYVHPRGLQLLREKKIDPERLEVGAVPYPVDGVPRDALRLKWKVGDSVNIASFDLLSGIMLYWHQKYVTHENREGNNIFQFVSARQVELPWAAAAPPAWVATVKSFRFQGTHTIHVTGTNPTPIALSATAEVALRGPNWLQLKVTSQGHMAGMPPGAPETAYSVSGSAQAGGMFISPLVLKKLQQGQVLDRDPALGLTLSVAGAGQGPDGKPCVVLSEQGAALTVTLRYDLESGLLRSRTQVNRTPLVTNTTVIDLTGVE